MSEPTTEPEAAPRELTAAERILAEAGERLAVIDARIEELTIAVKNSRAAATKAIEKIHDDDAAFRSAAHEELVGLKEERELTARIVSASKPRKRTAKPKGAAAK